MDRTPLIVKALAFGIFLLFVGVTIGQDISANIYQCSRETIYNTGMSTPERTIVSCSFFTLHGVEQVEKELMTQDAVYLSQVMNTSDSAALASELHRYGLLPQTMTVTQATEVINGVYVQKELQRVQQLLHANQSLDTDWMSNSLCSVRGYGPRSLYTTPRFWVWSTTLVFALYCFVTIPGFFVAEALSHIFNSSFSDIIFFFTVLLFYFPQMLAEDLYWNMGQWINPIKLPSAVVVAHLTTWDWAGDTETPYLNVSGRKGNWTIENYTGIGIHMIGFFGVWLSRYNGSNRASAQVKGYCLHINAKGLDDDHWDGWHDWPWL
jgi:hypothetical protein